jgi:virginiamycin B lyase
MARAACALIVAFTAALVSTTAQMAAQSSAAVLSGVVTSSSEPRMEGVLVSATRAGSPITVTVVSDAEGRYSFPGTRLEPGGYSLRVRAVGYELDAPAGVTIGAQPAQLDLTLRNTHDIASQLSNGEWFMSWPGSTEMKNRLQTCTQCHGLEPIARSRYTAAEWVGVIERMPHDAQRTPRGEGEQRIPAALVKQTADYLATVNLDLDGHWSYPLVTLPRPTGTATRVVITEYALSRPEALAHASAPAAWTNVNDAIADTAGYAWSGDRNDDRVVRRNTSTGEAIEYLLPRPTNIRRVSVDNRTSPPSLWVGTNLGASLIKVEPLP